MRRDGRIAGEAAGKVPSGNVAVDQQLVAESPHLPSVSSALADRATGRLTFARTDDAAPAVCLTLMPMSGRVGRSSRWHRNIESRVI
jgi:hypothetical protein